MADYDIQFSLFIQRSYIFLIGIRIQHMGPDTYRSWGAGSLRISYSLDGHSQYQSVEVTWHINTERVRKRNSN